tara:strand:+ start:1439 stop:1963 length:525 start_codon:yes stop_codon:yes gene_type:complete
MNYDEISPITGNKSVLIEADPNTGIESRICMESGYTTSDTLIIGSDAILKYEEAGLTEFMRAMKYIDNNLGTIWYPAFIQMERSMLYCDRHDQSSNKLAWKVARVVNIADIDKTKYPVPGKINEYYTSRLDVENALLFDQYQFKAALDQCYAFAAEEGNWSPTKDTTHIEQDLS